jgi:hypothetical protein
MLETSEMSILRKILENKQDWPSGKLRHQALMWD